jgi:hypothetical protein
VTQLECLTNQLLDVTFIAKRSITLISNLIKKIQCHKNTISGCEQAVLHCSLVSFVLGQKGLMANLTLEGSLYTKLKKQENKTEI